MATEQGKIRNGAFWRLRKAVSVKCGVCSFRHQDRIAVQAYVPGRDDGSRRIKHPRWSTDHPWLYAGICKWKGEQYEAVARHEQVERWAGDGDGFVGIPRKDTWIALADEEPTLP